MSNIFKEKTMYLTRYTPKSFSLLPEEIDALFDFYNFPLGKDTRDDVRITKDEKFVRIHIVALGFNRDELSIEVVQNVLNVRGFISKENNRGYFTRNFDYSWTLTDEHDKTKIESELKNGVLTVTIPFKTPEKKVEEKLRIEIK